MSKFFIDRPIFAIVIAILIMLAGGLSIFTLPVEQYPADRAAVGADQRQLSPAPRPRPCRTPWCR